MHKELEGFVNRLFRIGAVKIDILNGFRLRVHQYDPTLPLSPIYVEFGTTDQKPNPGPLEPADVVTMARLFWSLQLMNLKLDFGAVAGVPHGGTAPAQELIPAAYHMSGRELECLVLGKIDKGEHSHVGGIIRGNKLPETNVVLIEDATSTGRSLEETAEQVRLHGYKVTDAVAFLDRMQGAKTTLRDKSRVRLHCVMTMAGLLSTGRCLGHVTEEQRIHVLRYLEGDRARRVRLALAAAS